MKLKLGKKKSVKDQFVLSIGDEGVVFCYFQDGKLTNKLFVESIQSPDVKLIEKLMETYPNTPVSVLVDVIEQNYSQQVLPPVSSFGIRQQVQRRIKRDLQANDFNNFLLINRAKEGRKDWNFLFISLANSDPFAKWLEVVLTRDNPFEGVYLLPLEATKLQDDINSLASETRKTEWELLVLHNKVGGFRIIAFKNGKLIFTRLAQNLVGDNIPDIVVGNMEQEISNTVEYLKRLAFKGESESKITIIAGAEILQKIDIKNIKFGAVDLFTPFQIAEKLSLPESVAEKDKFADILIATHFATVKSHILKFNSPFTKKVEQLYLGIKAAKTAFAFGVLLLMGLAANEVYEINTYNSEKETVLSNKARNETKKEGLLAKKKSLPNNLDKMLDIKEIVSLLPEDKYRSLRVINDVAPIFGEKNKVKSISMSVEEDNAKKTFSKFKLEIEMTFVVAARDQDLMNTIGTNFINEAKKVLDPYKYDIVYANEPKAEKQSDFEQIASVNTSNGSEQVSIPAKISITGAFR